MWQSSHSSRTFSGRSPLRSWCRCDPLPLGPKGLPQRSQRLGRSLSTRRLRRWCDGRSRPVVQDCLLRSGGGWVGQGLPGATRCGQPGRGQTFQLVTWGSIAWGFGCGVCVPCSAWGKGLPLEPACWGGGGRGFKGRSVRLRAVQNTGLDQWPVWVFWLLWDRSVRPRCVSALGATTTRLHGGIASVRGRRIGGRGPPRLWLCGFAWLPRLPDLLANLGGAGVHAIRAGAGHAVTAALGLLDEG